MAGRAVYQAAAMEPPRGPDTPIATVFFRELAETYLLIDHLSSQADKCLPARLVAQRHGKGDCGDWIARICEITWPPTGDRQAIAKDAEFLIMTRDALNRLAEPATGASIAFTRMVVDSDLASAGQDASSSAKQLALPQALSAWGLEPGRPVHNRNTGLTRYDLATQAFPELERPAQEFARFYRRFVFGLILALLLVLSLSWYVATGNDLLRQVHQARLIFQGPEASGKTTSASAESNPAGTLLALGATSQQQQQYLCSRYVAARTNLARWAPPWPVTFDPTKQCITTNDEVVEPGNDADLDSGLWAAALVNVLGNRVLPACYGLLGAWAAVLRSLSASVEKSELARRHRMTSLVKLALGTVIGACIGLFVGPTADGDGGQTPPGLLGTATISFSALSFLAGYGVQHVFRLFDGLLSRVFNPPDPTKKTA